MVITQRTEYANHCTTFFLGNTVQPNDLPIFLWTKTTDKNLDAWKVWNIHRIECGKLNDSLPVKRHCLGIPLIFTEEGTYLEKLTFVCAMCHGVKSVPLFTTFIIRFVDMFTLRVLHMLILGTAMTHSRH